MEDGPHVSSSSASLVTLPPELRQAILCAVPDSSSLRALALSCSSYYHAFREMKSHIISKILSDGVPLELLPTALLVHESSSLKSWCKDPVLDFLPRLRNGRAPATANVSSAVITFSDALSISGLYDHVRFFTADFASLALSAHPIGAVPDPAPEPLSSQEQRRIERAFYRFELYCNLFRNRRPNRGGNHSRDHRFTTVEQQDYFFSLFPAWENEQLACIHDYLFQRLSKPFNDMAEHDIEWGGWERKPAHLFEEPDNCGMQYFLSCGLRFLRQVIQAETYDERQGLMQEFHIDTEFLHDGLTATSDLGQWLTLSNALAEDGPSQAWRWAHSVYETSELCYLSYAHWNLRERGYVMWDLPRLSRWGLFREPFFVTDPPVNFEESNRRNEEMEQSWNERSRISQRGGWGWWSADDQSKVQWPEPVHEKPAYPYPKPTPPARFPAFETYDQFKAEMKAWREKVALAKNGD
ncbi:MAG: hypothetical protein M1837_001509 [Sclerophora amabilis]|nr:MAG: hypothetical protein M1837_001509 [Sclerophora amabilis]